MVGHIRFQDRTGQVVERRGKHQGSQVLHYLL